MAKRSDLAQKLLDDLRQKKQQMGLANAAGHHQRADTSRSESLGSSRRSYGSGEASTGINAAGYHPQTSKSTSSAATTRKSSKHGSRGTSIPEISSTEVVPFQRARRSEQVADLSMAIAIALNNYGSQVKLEFFGNGVGNSGLVPRIGSPELQGTNRKNIPNGNLFLTGQLPYLSDLQIGQISQGAHNLDMILRAYSDGLVFDRDSIQMSQKLVKGAKDLEESLKLLSTLQETSAQSTVRPQRKQAQIKLLKDNGEEEASDVEQERSMALSRPRFSFGSILKFFIGDSKENKRKNKHEKKQIASCYPAQKKSHLPNPEKSSSSGSTQSVSHKWFASSSSDHNKGHASSSIKNQVYVNQEVNKNLSSKVTDKEKVSTDGRLSIENKKMTLQGNVESEKVRIPNVIVKLMGLEEIPPHKMELKGNDAKYPSPVQIKSSVQKNSTSLSDKSASANQEKRKQEYGSGKSPTCDILTSRVQENSTSLSDKSPIYGSGKPPTYDILTSCKGKESLYNPVREEKRETVITNSKKPISLTHKQMELLSKGQLEAGLAKEDQGKLRRQNLKEKQKVLKQLDTRDSYTEYNLKNTLQQPYGLKKGKDNRKELQNRENKSPLISNHQFKVANRNQPLRATQRPRPDDAVDRVATRHKSIAKNSRTTNQERKSGRLEINPIISTTYASSSRSNDAFIEEIVANEIFLAENLAKLKQKENQSKEATMDSSNATSIEAHRIPHEKFIELRPLKTEYRSAKRKINSFTKASKISWAVQIHGLEKESKDSRKEAEETGLSIPKQKISLLQDLEEMRYEGNSETDGMKLSSMQPHLKEESKMVLISSMGEETKLVPYTVVIEDKASGQQLPERSIHVKRNLDVCDLAGRRFEEYTDDNNEKSRDHDNLKQRNHTDPEAIRKEQLTEDENHLMEILTGNQQFLNAVGAFLGLDIPGNTTQGGKICQESEDKLALDFGYEVVRRKGKIEHMTLISPMKPSPAIFKAITLESLVKELNNEIKTLKFSKEKKESDCDLTVEYLHKMVECDIENTKPCVNCTWDLGWSCRIFATQDIDLAIKDIEKHIFSTLLGEVLKELL